MTGLASVTVTPSAPASAATTRSVTTNWVSQRRSCRPSLVFGLGSAAVCGEARSAASRASISVTATGSPATVAATCRWAVM